MGILKKLFGSSETEDEKELPWIALNDLNQLSLIEKKSATKTR